MGGSITRAPFGPLVNIVCHVVRCMHTPTIIEEDAKTFITFEDKIAKIDAEKVSNKVQLSQESLDYLTNKELIKIIMNGEYEIDDYAKALAHVCFGNKKLTKQICLFVIKAISIDGDRIS